MTQVVVRLFDNFVEVITHDQLRLADESAHEDHGGEDLEGNDLEVELDEADASSPVERLPGVEHADASAAADDRGLDSAAEAPVEGDDGLVFLGQHRCLHAGQSNLGGEYDGEDDEQGDQRADEDLGGVAREDFGGDFAVVGRVLGVALEAVGAEHEGGDVESELLGGGPDGRGEEDFAAGVEAGEAAPPALGAWGAHDDVGPGHVEAAEDGVGDDGEEGLCEQGAGEAAEEVEEQTVGQVVDDGDMQTAEARPWAGLSLQVLYGGADLGGDGLAFDEEELWLGGSCLRVMLLI